MNFKVQRNCTDTGKISSSVSFHQYYQLFHVNFKICFGHLVWLEMIYFENRIWRRILQYNPNNLGTKVLNTCYYQTSGAFLLNCFCQCFIDLQCVVLALF